MQIIFVNTAGGTLCQPQTILKQKPSYHLRSHQHDCGNSIGTGIIAAPYLATKNSMLDVVWMVLIAYCVNVILHLIIAELSYNNGGVQLVKSFEGELFHGR